MRFLLILTFGIGLTISWAGASPAAMAEIADISVSVQGPTGRLLIDGITTTTLPSTVTEPGSTVCVIDTVTYTSTNERWTFERWNTGEITLCIEPTTTGTYTAMYTREVLFHVKSVQGRPDGSQWVPAGVPVRVEAPETIPEVDGVRYRFSQWNEGETPSDPVNVIAPLHSMTMTPTFVKEYLVSVTGPDGADAGGSGWYAEGSPVGMRTPHIIGDRVEGERLVFQTWEIDGEPSISNSVSPIGVSQATAMAYGPFEATANYEKQFFVEVKTPSGTSHRQWMTEGEELAVEVMAVHEIAPEQRRLVFTHWEGEDGLISPKIAGLVDKPTKLTAMYNKEVFFTVDFPLGGSGGGWHRVGSSVQITVPESVQSHVIFRKSFQGFPGYTAARPSFELIAREPLTITALYSNEANTGVVALLLFIPSLGVAILVLMRTGWGGMLVQRIRKPSAS